MSGLLIGILLARTASGFVAAYYGWRCIYLLAAVTGIVLAGVLRLVLPTSKPTHHESYGKLLRSLAHLVRDEPILRESGLFGACLFAGFGSFWTTLSFLLAKAPFFLKSDSVGLFGLVGVVGALAAPSVGRFTDRGSPRTTVLIGLVFLLLAYVIFGLSSASLVGLVIGVLLLDVGVQGGHISNQTRVFAIRPEARSRMNTVYMTCYFGGGSLGSAISASAWSRWGWNGVCAVGAGFAIVGLAAFAATANRQPKRGVELQEEVPLSPEDESHLAGDSA